MAKNKKKFNYGDRVVHDNKGKGTFLFYDNHGDAIVQFDFLQYWYQMFDGVFGPATVENVGNGRLKKIS